MKLFSNLYYRTLHALAFWFLALKSLFFQKSNIPYIQLNNSYYSITALIILVLYFYGTKRANRNTKVSLEKKIDEINKKHAINVKQIKFNHYRTLEIILRSTHKLNGEIRDSIYNIRSQKKAGDWSPSRLSDILKSTSQKCLNELSSTLAEITKSEVCVHIKVFRLINGKRSEKLMTLCNCNVSGKYDKRYSLREYSIEKNFMYNLSLQSQSNHIYIPDFPNRVRILESQDKESKTEIPSSIINKFYKSIVVVPIQLRKGNRMKLEHYYDVIGVLIADSQTINAFSRNLEGIILNTMKTYADGLYTLYDKVHYLQKKYPQ